MLIVLSHPDCAGHRPPADHPESPARQAAALRGLEGLDGIEHRQAEEASDEQLRLAHDVEYLQDLERLDSAGAAQKIDPDTWLGPGSTRAARLAVGAVCQGVEAVIEGSCPRALALVRPPGHHAEADHAMGFCLYGSVAIAALAAREVQGLERVAICDFDVHHGNGTEAIVAGEKGILFISSHQSPLYPCTGDPDATVADNIVNATLPPQADGKAFRRLWSETLLPRLDAFRPQLILVSAGFDGHIADPLAQLELDESDYNWIGQELRRVADRHADGRLVASLEGGYDLGALERSVRAFAQALL